MNKSIIRFSENIHLATGLASAMAMALFSCFFLSERHLGNFSLMIPGYVMACLVALSSLRSLGISMTMTPTSLTRKSLLSEIRIRWDEMQRIEIGPSCFWLVFESADKRIWMRRPASSFESWFRHENEEDHEDPIVSSLLDMAEQHGVPIECGTLTAFKTSRS